MRGSRLLLITLLALAAVTYLPSLRNDFVNFDDDVLVTDNPYVRSLSPSNLAAIFTRPLTNIYHPLTFFSYALDFRLWGLSPFGFHLTNYLLHLATTALVFRWMTVFAGSLPAAFTAALLFSLHPMRVEAVAWIAGRKDLLAGFFFMASLLAFEHWAREGKRRMYATALGLFLLAGLSKATAITLPAVLVLADYLHRRLPSRRVLLEKIPFFAVSAVLAAVAVASRSSFEASAEPLLYSPLSRVYILGHRLVFYYLQRTVAPTRGLDNLYPDLVGGTMLPDVLAWGSVLALIVLALAVSARRTRKGIYGAGFFLLTLLPSLAAVSYGFTADRFSYVPSIGLSYLAGVAVATTLSASRETRWARPLMVALGIAIVGALGWTTRDRIAVWKDSVALWDDAVQHFRSRPTSVNLGLALEHRGRSRLEQGDYRGAIVDLTEAAPIAPERQFTLLLRAQAFAALGEPEAAAVDLREALSLAPGFEEARVLLERLAHPDSR